MAIILFILNHINRCINYKYKNTYFISIIRSTSNNTRQSYENYLVAIANRITDPRMRAYDVTALASLPLAAAILLDGSTGGTAVSLRKTSMARGFKRTKAVIF